jgi:hypothetical protein
MLIVLLYLKNAWFANDRFIEFEKQSIKHEHKTIIIKMGNTTTEASL